MNFNFEFINRPTKEFFDCSKRNSCLSGGYGSGKTYVACMKILFLVTMFSRYRVIIARQEYKALLETTWQTFTKICPEHLYHWDKIAAKMTFKNGSEILWMHLDAHNERSLRGMEVNTVYIDQAEEIKEEVYTTLEPRVGRWDKAEPTADALKQFGYKDKSEWPKDEYGTYVIPSYMMLTPNPDVETHWIWQLYHPDSKKAKKYQETNAYFQVSSRQNPRLNKDTLAVMLQKDPSWVARFVDGAWGISDAVIHIVPSTAIIDLSKEYIENFLKKSRLYRVLDHGESAPTCCLWFAVHKNIHMCYREYYMPREVISVHRKNIADLSGDEPYIKNLADPQIFKKTGQKNGGHWSTADEYLDKSIEAPPIAFIPADNNEMATRNRINELLAFKSTNLHPVTGEPDSPSLYFINKTPSIHNYGCEHAIIQMQSQRREKIGEIEGKVIYSDDRAPNVEDHSYDCVRYYVADHAKSPNDPPRRPSETSFFGQRNRMKALKYASESKYNQFGDRKTIQ
jgi:hypothetical protein